MTGSIERLDAVIAAAEEITARVKLLKDPQAARAALAIALANILADVTSDGKPTPATEGRVDEAITRFGYAAKYGWLSLNRPKRRRTAQ